MDQPFSAARSFDHALDILAFEAGELGFDAVDYGYLPQVRATDGGWVAATIVTRNVSANLMRDWPVVGRHDPYLCSSYERTLPLDWRDVRGARWLTREQKRTLAYIDDVGFPDGVTVPIHLPGGRFAFVSGVARTAAGRWRANEATAKERLFLLAHRFQAVTSRQARAAGDPQQPPALSAREQECLRYAASGFSAPETATIICRSVETVRSQRKSAMRKLSARTLSEAVARAGSLGLLDRSIA